jgi:hypothetical protein
MEPQAAPLRAPVPAPSLGQPADASDPGASASVTRSPWARTPPLQVGAVGAPNASCQLATASGRALEGRQAGPVSALGGRLCRGSTQARRYAQGTLASSLRWLAGVYELEAEAGRDLNAAPVVLEFGLLDPQALLPLCGDREPPLAAVFHVLVRTFGSAVGCRHGSESDRYWKNSLLRGSWLLLWTCQLAKE